MAGWKDEQSRARLQGTKYGEKLMAFAVKVQAESQHRLREQDLACEANLTNAITWVKFGNKYDKVDIGNSGRFMVEARTGEIFGIKSYGKVHRGHAYGTLDTIDEFYWGEYYPKRLDRKADEDKYMGKVVRKADALGVMGEVVGLVYEGNLLLKVRWAHNSKTVTVCTDKVRLQEELDMIPI